MARFCGHLDRAVGAEPLLAYGCLVTDTEGSLVMLPNFIWAPSAIRVGRKHHSRNGGRYLLPVRLSYSCGPVLLLEPGEAENVTVRAKGMGYDITGSVEVRPVRDTLGRSLTTADDGLPEEVHETTPRSVNLLVRRALDAADIAKWQALAMVHGQAETGMRHAVARLQRSVSATNTNPGIDTHVRERAMTELLYGARDGHRSPVLRLVDQCLRPDAFVHVDPLRYVTRAIARDSDQVLARVVGDPRFGPKLRALLAEVPDGVTAADLAAEYNARHPNRRPVSEAGARAAMELDLPMELPVGTDPLGFDNDDRHDQA